MEYKEIFKMEDSRNYDYEVISPLGTVVLTGRSNMAIRVATREGKVKTGLTFYLEKRPVRLLIVEDVLKYWKEAIHENELKAMREKPIFLEVDGFRFKVLHPNGFISYSIKDLEEMGDD